MGQEVTIQELFAAITTLSEEDRSELFELIQEKYCVDCGRVFDDPHCFCNIDGQWEYRDE